MHFICSSLSLKVHISAALTKHISLHHTSKISFKTTKTKKIMEYKNARAISYARHITDISGRIFTVHSPANGVRAKKDINVSQWAIVINTLFLPTSSGSN